MRFLALAWCIGFLAIAVTSGLLALQITDDVERDLPLERRPSWRLFKVKRFPWREVKLHSQMYPEKRGLRVWWSVTTALMYLLLIGTFAGALLWNSR